MTDDREDLFRRTVLGQLDPLFRLARRLSGDWSVAEDLVQETVLQAWRSFDRFQPGTDCRAWLFKILVFVWSHERRRRMRHPIVFDTELVEQQRLVYEPPIPDSLTEAHVLAAFESMPPSMQVVVMLADVEQRSYREIADVLSIPIGTVMSRLSRGRQLLRLKLAEYARERGFDRQAPAV
jgi:RNA polymerase sigma-70 factor (ECF subfamily)